MCERVEFNQYIHSSIGKERRVFVRVLNIGIIFFSDLAQKRRCSQFSRMKRCCDPMTSMSLRPGKTVFQIVRENFAYEV